MEAFDTEVYKIETKISIAGLSSEKYSKWWCRTKNSVGYSDIGEVSVVGVRAGTRRKCGLVESVRTVGEGGDGFFVGSVCATVRSC